MRISIFGGPGCGKSVTAAKIFVELKVLHYDIELVHEFIKTWAYENKVPKSFDQHYIFGKQMHAEDVLLSNGVKHIVTDSPLMMQLCYVERSGKNFSHMLSAAKEFEDKYPSLNIFLERKDLKYQEKGRWESETQAKEMDDRILNFLNRNDISFSKVLTCSFANLMQLICHELSLQV